MGNETRLPGIRSTSPLIKDDNRFADAMLRMTSLRDMANIGVTVNVQSVDLSTMMQMMRDKEADFGIMKTSNTDIDISSVFILLSLLL